MKYILALILFYLTGPTNAQSLGELLEGKNLSSIKNLPKEVYIVDLCKECGVSGLDEYKLFTGGSMLDASTSRDFRTFVLSKNSTYLDPITDSFQDCSVYYVLYANRDIFEIELNKLAEDYTLVINKYRNKKPIIKANGMVLHSISIMPISWPHSSRHPILLRGFEIIVYSTQ